LIHAGAGAGGVGHIAIQLARLHGCRVITTAGRAESIAFCRDVLRVDEVIDYRTRRASVANPSTLDPLDFFDVRGALTEEER
jgi:NADPH-dependent curcumin reductase CurA